MSRQLFARNADLQHLRTEGYYVEVQDALLIMRDVPYLNANREVKKGIIISNLTLAGDITQPPSPHTVHFVGEYPCNSDGSRITQIENQTALVDLGNGLIAQHTFSNKPTNGYTDYFHKMTTYADIISGPVHEVAPEATAKVFGIPDEEEDSIFNYRDTASARAGISRLADLLKPERIGIIGLGGSGSYILDFVAKTAVREIRIIDADEFLQHNAFRAPGAPALEELREIHKKVDYLKRIYDKMHRGIVAHAEILGEHNLNLLDDLTFVFLSMDGGSAKRAIIDRLLALGIPFVDTGMGLTDAPSGLGGIVQLNTVTPEKHDHIAQRISFSDDDDQLYSTNIQVSELNALNAVMAVIKWKKLRKFYRDFVQEHHSSYTIDTNQTDSEDTTC